MLSKKSCLLLFVVITTMHCVQAEHILRFRNQSPFTVQIIVPEHDVATQEELEHITSQKTIIEPARSTAEITSIFTPDVTQSIWLHIPTQPRYSCQKINLNEICIISDPATIYDLYIALETHRIKWFAILFCHGFLDLHRIAMLHASGYYSVHPYQEGHRKVCFPIYSKNPGVTDSNAQHEVIRLSMLFHDIYSTFLLTHKGSV